MPSVNEQTEPCLDENKLSALASGLLCDPHLSDAERHLDGCVACQELLAVFLRDQSPDPGAGTAGAAGSARGAGPPGRTASVQLVRGSLVGRYVVVSHLGSGGMGMVYAAYDPELERTVALKLLRSGRGHEVDSQAASARMLREARALARVSHPNVVTIHDVGRSGDHQIFLAMERIQGETLRAWLRGERRPLREILSRFRCAGEGLCAVHEAGIVHRDFKADNVLLADDGRVLVTDFGLARVVAAADAVDRPQVGPSDAGSLGTLTQSERLLGTPAYMSPEQIAGHAVDARADQFSFCAVLYEALHGERPFRGRSMEEQLAAIARGVIEPSASSRPVPRWIDEVLWRGLSRDPAARFAGMRALLGALSVSPTERLMRRLLPLGAVAAGAVALGMPYYLVRVRPASRCQAAASLRSESAYSARQAQAIERAFAQTGLGYAGQTAAVVQAALADYAKAWQGAQSQACKAEGTAEGAKLSALRSACLDQRLRGLSALASRLEQADARTVEKASYAVSALARSSDCLDLARLTARIHLPSDEKTRMQVEAIRAQLVDAQAALDTGAFVAGLQRAEPLLGPAQALGFRPLESEVLRLLGNLHKEAARFGPAADALTAAVYKGEAGSHDESVARASIALVDVQMRQAHYAEARQWLSHAEAAIERLGGDDALSAWLLNNHGNLLHAEGKYQEALEQQKRALALRQRLFGAAHSEVAMSLNNLGATYSALGRYAEAIQHHEQAQKMHAELLGSGHPSVGNCWLNLGQARGQAGDVAGELRAYEQVLAIWGKALPADHLHLAIVHHNLGSAYGELSQPQEALLHYAKARAIKAQKLSPDHPSLASTRLAESVQLRKLGRLSEAMAAARAAYAMYEQSVGASHPLAARALTEIGSCELREGRAAQAKETLAKALSRHRAAESEPDVLGDTELLLAQALWRSGGDRGQARKLAEAAQKTYQRISPSAAGVATARAWLSSPH